MFDTMIYFVRHGESEANVRGVFAGQRDDSALTEEGKKQALITAQKIKEDHMVPNRIISSPLRRALETASIIADEIGIDSRDIEIDDRITEYDMGTLTGTPLHVISSIALASADEAEDTESFKQRVAECIRNIPDDESVLLVSHAGVGRVLETIKNGMESKFFYDLPAWGNASVTEIDWVK